ncbi:MAG: phosphatase PAP2 family protein [Bacteroidota bacterium]|nr:phosphatase PAP2 family protein [Bacteroidota bacterium]
MKNIKKNLIWYLAGGLIAVFMLLTAFVFLDPLSKIDREFSEEIQEHHYLVLDQLMRGISAFGYMPVSAILVGATALFFLLCRYKREALFVMLSALSGLISTLVKLLVNRPRPAASLVRVLEKTQQQSFPSGHVLFYVVFFGFLLLLMYQLTGLPRILRRAISILSLLLIFTIPISRIYLGAHWFTDVLGGFILGLLTLVLLAYAYLNAFVKTKD